MKIHELKTWSEYYYFVESELKNFEVRNNDRNYSVGDVLYLRETNKDTGQYTGNSCLREITYILNTGGAFGIAADTVVLSLKFIANY